MVLYIFVRSGLVDLNSNYLRDVHISMNLQSRCVINYQTSYAFMSMYGVDTSNIRLRFYGYPVRCLVY